MDTLVDNLPPCPYVPPPWLVRFWGPQDMRDPPEVSHLVSEKLQRDPKRKGSSSNLHGSGVFAVELWGVDTANNFHIEKESPLPNTHLGIHVSFGGCRYLILFCKRITALLPKKSYKETCKLGEDGFQQWFMFIFLVGFQMGGKKSTN